MATFKQYENSKGKFWEVKAYLGKDEETGKQVQFTERGFKTKKQAVDYFKQESRKFDSGLSLQNKNFITVTQLYHEWLEQYKLNVTKSTLRNTKTYFRLHILPPLGNILITKLQPKTIQKAVNEWHRKYKKHKKIFNYLKRVLQYGVTLDYIQSNPCSRVAIPKKKLQYDSPQREKDFYSKDELELFFNCLQQEDSLKWLCFFRILAFTGLRRGEALALTWEDINFKQSTITVSKAVKLGEQGLYIGDPKNQSSTRTLNVDSETMKIIRKWKTEQAKLFLKLGYNLLGSDEFIFRKESENFPISVASPRNFLARFCERNSLPMINIHGFRHTHCSLLFEAGVPMKDVKERMGHSDISTTMNVYTHVTENSKKQSVQKFAKYINF